MSVYPSLEDMKVDQVMQVRIIISQEVKGIEARDYNSQEVF